MLMYFPSFYWRSSRELAGARTFKVLQNLRYRAKLGIFSEKRASFCKTKMMTWRVVLQNEILAGKGKSTWEKQERPNRRPLTFTRETTMVTPLIDHAIACLTDGWWSRNLRDLFPKPTAIKRCFDSSIANPVPTSEPPSSTTQYYTISTTRILATFGMKPIWLRFQPNHLVYSGPRKEGEADTIPNF